MVNKYNKKQLQIYLELTLITFLYMKIKKTVCVYWFER